MKEPSGRGGRGIDSRSSLRGLVVTGGVDCDVTGSGIGGGGMLGGLVAGGDVVERPVYIDVPFVDAASYPEFDSPFGCAGVELIACV